MQSHRGEAGGGEGARAPEKWITVPPLISFNKGSNKWEMSVRVPIHPSGGCAQRGVVYMAAFTWSQDAIAEQFRIYALLDDESKKDTWSLVGAKLAARSGTYCPSRHRHALRNLVS